MDSEDFRWLGAWWLGYLVFGLITIFHALIVSGFPASLPGSQAVRDEHILKGITVILEITRNVFQTRGAVEFLMFVQDFLVQPDYCMRTSVWEEQFRTFLFLAHFHSEVENFQFLTMIFSENFLSIEIFLE